ncbi:hypothetical protein AB0872_20755 [Microbacterium sp. NPDC047426]
MPAETDPTRTVMTDAEAEAQARRIIADFATSYRDQTLLPRYGDAPPVPQPGRPPMSSKAVDDTARMLGASVLIAVSGGSTTAILWASGYANPAVVALVFGAPTALALAIGRVMKRAKEATPDVHHHHYAGHVDQRTVQTKTTGLWARTNNQQ